MSPEQYLRDLSHVLREASVQTRGGTEIDLSRGVMEIDAMLGAARRTDALVICIGNGASATIASHLAVDLLKTRDVRAATLHDAALVTAMANDVGARSMFNLSVGRLMRAGDVLVAISSSGRSENVLRATQAARNIDCGIVTFSAFDGDNPLRTLGDINVYVPARSYGLAESAHAALMHCALDCGGET